MRRDFRVVKEQWFLKNKYPISYPLFICHALMNKTRDYIEAKKLLSGLHYQIKHHNNFYVQGFLEVIPFKDKTNKSGYVVVDRSQGCYPLVLYPDDNDPDHGDRCGAFTNALVDIEKNLQNIMRELQRHKTWTQATQEALHEILPFEKAKKSKP